MLSRARYIAAALLSTAALAGCDTRAPVSTLHGTWQHATGIGHPDLLFEFRPDQSFAVVAPAGGEPVVEGRWYAGGDKIYMRYPAGVMATDRPIIWHIVDISRDELSVRVWREGEVIRYRRVTPPRGNASNQAMQLTAVSFPINV
jgi:hypothetical protein